MGLVGHKDLTHDFMSLILMLTEYLPPFLSALRIENFELHSSANRNFHSRHSEMIFRVIFSSKSETSDGRW